MTTKHSPFTTYKHHYYYNNDPPYYTLSLITYYILLKARGTNHPNRPQINVVAHMFSLSILGELVIFCMLSFKFIFDAATTTL